MQVDHIGYAVKKMDKAIESFSVLGYSFGEIFTDEKRGIYICFGNNGSFRIELISPIPGFESPADGWLKKNGPSPYHICYVSDNLEEDLETLSKQKFKVIIPPDTAIAFGGKRVAFLFNLQQGLLEIVEK